MGNIEGVIFYLIKGIFITHIIKCLPRPEFQPSGEFFTLRAPVYTVLSEVWPHANRAMVTNN